MNYLKQRMLRGVLSLAVIICASPASAFVSDVSSSPSQFKVLAGQSQSISVIWIITRQSTTASPPAVVSSKSGRFLATANGPLLGTVNTSLSQSLPLKIPTPINETLQVPANVIAQAVQMGLNSFVYQRTFDDGGGSAEAQITLNITVVPTGFTLSASPSRLNVPLGQSVSINVVWTVKRQGGVGTLLVTSSQGRFLATSNGPLLGTVNTSLSKSVMVQVPTPFREVVLVPRHVIQKAFTIGLSHFIYQRGFDDGGGTIEKSIQLNITGSGGSGFSINRLALRFEDDSAARLIFQGDILTAKAEITSSGSGLLQGLWEIADPSSTAGEPVFRPFQAVHRQLATSQKVILSSPSLPTGQIGIHLVRFRITSPKPAFDIPVIHYFASTKKSDRPLSSKPIKLVSPKSGARLSTETPFIWEILPDSVAYQLEIFLKRRSPGMDGPSQQGGRGEAQKSRHPFDFLERSEPAEPAREGKRITGMLLSADRKNTTLSSLVYQHLKPGQTYVWRIIAMDKKGAIIGKSPFREIRTPDRPLE